MFIFASYDDDRVMEFVLMRLTFSDGPSGESSIHPPVFSHVTGFRTTGVVMNVFLLDPSERLLSAFIWVSTSNTIGLYALPDWNKKEYVFIDTGIECVSIPQLRSYATLTVVSRSCPRIGLASCTNNISSYIAKKVMRLINIFTLSLSYAHTSLNFLIPVRHLSSHGGFLLLEHSRKDSLSHYLPT